ncbi:platelet glycoprotein V [Elgaria multicarinata webbii]|uniref:platelet glycoprotein V n=1 Tax=Elgaria multicarinata webbii TaxID=159646 RepID=UPI002FCD01B8
MLLLPAALLLLLFQPSVVSECSYVLRDAFRCSGAGIHDLASLGIPNNVTQMLIMSTSATELADGLFADMKVLQRLILSSNQLSAISPGCFEGLGQLKTLKLSNNKLRQLPGGVFDPLLRLQQLALEHNRLLSLPPGLFDRLLNLQELSLSKNFLAALPGQLFRRLARLEQLDLSRNQLVALPRNIFSTLSSLKKLILSANGLASLEPGLFAHLGALLELQLHSCAIGAVAPGAFHGLRQLQTLTLSDNRLPTLPAELFFPLRRLARLTLHRNPLQALPRRLFGETPHLHSLCLCETRLSTLPALMLSNLTRLERLGLSLNPRLSALPGGVFRGLASLEALSLHSNNLSSLAEEVFGGLENLRELSLFGNRITGLPPNVFRHLGRLETLYLNNTGLRALPGDVFASLPSLQKVWLDGNPWRCCCELAAFASWLRKNTGLVQDAAAVTCHSPPALRHTPVHAVPQGQLACPATTARAHWPSQGQPSPSPPGTELVASAWQPTPGTSRVPQTAPASSAPLSDASTEILDAAGIYSSGAPVALPYLAEYNYSYLDPTMDTPMVIGQRWWVFNLKSPIGWVLFSLHLLALVTQALAVGATLYVALQVWQVRARRRNAPAVPVLTPWARGAEPGPREAESSAYCTIGLVLKGS